MGRHVRNREVSGEVAEMAAPGGRKRKTIIEETEISTSSVELKTRRLASTPPYNPASPASSGDSTCESLCCCSSSRSGELEKESPKFADLEENAVNVEYCATSADHSVDFRERRERTPPSEVTEPGELESAVMHLESEKMPTEAELEEFFAAAEKNLQKQFIDKYNFDIVKDEPLEGRYEWVPVKLTP